MDTSMYAQWLSSHRCPAHDEAAEIVVNRGPGDRIPHIEITGCCKDFVSTVEHKIQGLLNANVQTLTRPRGNVIG